MNLIHIKATALLISERTESELKLVLRRYLLSSEFNALNRLLRAIINSFFFQVTEHYAFPCPGNRAVCDKRKSLSLMQSHIDERQQCLSHFTRVYGYMPLLNTQFRADSILYNTRTSGKKQKCFDSV